MKRGSKILALLTALVMLLSLGVFAASGEAETAEEAVEGYGISAWPSFESPVFVAGEKDENAVFFCYGEFDAWGDITPFAADTAAVALYDAETDGALVGECEAVYDKDAAAWRFEFALPAVNTVYWVSVDGGLTAPVYVVVNQTETAKTLYNKTIADGGETDASLEMSKYAPIQGVNASDDGLYHDEYLGMDIVRPYIGTNSTLFELSDFADMADASDYDKAAVNWWIHSGFTNGADSLYTFGYERPAFYTFELTLFVYRYFGIYDNAYGKPMAGFSIGSEPYFVSLMNTNGTGIIDDIHCVVPQESVDCSAAMTYTDILATLYNAMTSAYAKLSEAGEAAAASLAAADTAQAKAEAMAALLGLEVADYDAEVSKMEAIGILYELAQGNYITPMTYPDTDYAIATAMDVEGSDEPTNGNDKTAAYEVDTFIDKDARLTGEDAVIDIEGNYNALVVADGAKVTIENPYLCTTTSNSDYGFGGGAVLMARDAGTCVSLLGTDGSVNVNVQTGSSAGGLMPLCSAAIYSRNLKIFSPGTHTSNLTYNGVLWYDNGTVLGDGRIFSTDYWGGYLMYNESVSFKGEGSGSCVLDETSLVYYKNSYLHGSSTSEINGCGTVYYENCVADFDAFYEFHNNTSYWTDTGSLYAVNSVLNFGESFYWDAKAAKSVVTLADSKVTLNDDSEYAIAIGYTKGGKDFMTSEEMEPGAEAVSYIVKSLEGPAAEQVNGYSILRLDGDSSITGGAQKLYVGERYTLAIETGDDFTGSVEFTLDRSDAGNTGTVMVNGEVVTGEYNEGGVTIHVAGVEREAVSFDLAALKEAFGL